MCSDDDIADPPPKQEMVISDSSEAELSDSEVMKDSGSQVRVLLEPYNNSDAKETRSFNLEVNMTFEDLLHVISSTRDLKNPQDYAFYKGERDDIYGGGGEKYDLAEPVLGGYVQFEWCFVLDCSSVCEVSQNRSAKTGLISLSETFLTLI